MLSMTVIGLTKKQKSELDKKIYDVILKKRELYKKEYSNKITPKQYEKQQRELDDEHRELNKLKIEEIKKDMEEREKEIAEKQKEIAEVQRARAIKSAHEAIRQKEIADEKSEEAKKQKEIADINAQAALDQKQIAENASERAEILRMLSIAQSMAVKSLQVNNDEQLKSLVSYQAYQFNKNFPDWGSHTFWQKECNDLREQLGCALDLLTP